MIGYYAQGLLLTVFGVPSQQDGLLSFNMRELANIPDDNPKWIMLDGDLDANWIESMNSVMGECACCAHDRRLDPKTGTSML